MLSSFLGPPYVFHITSHDDVVGGLFQKFNAKFFKERMMIIILQQFIVGTKISQYSDLHCTRITANL